MMARATGKIQQVEKIWLNRDEAMAYLVHLEPHDCTKRLN